MIDESKTLYIYGYTSDELLPKSHKPIVAICDGCGTYRDTDKAAYRDLCTKCSHTTPEYIAKASANSIKQFADPEARKRSSDRTKSYFADNPEARKRASVKTIQQFADPRVRAKHSDLMKAYLANNPEAKKRMYDQSKAYYADPEARKRMSDLKKSYFADNPEARKRVSNQMKARYAKMDDPGEEIVKHHYIYDHTDLSKYTMQITRRRHAWLHNCMRNAGIEVPHINMTGGE